MKRPTPASLKKVTPENLTRLGAERLAAILAAAAETKPELKRRLRMELAAEQGPEHLIPEIDRRLGSLATSRSRVSWRQRPGFVRDVDALRALIVERLAGLEGAPALERLLQFMELARPTGARLHDRKGELAAVFRQAAEDLGGLLGDPAPEQAAARLVEVLVGDPQGGSNWLPKLLQHAPSGFATAALRSISRKPAATAAWTPLVRQLADAAGDVDAFRATFTATGLRDPSIAAAVAQRFLAAGRIGEAGQLLEGARPRQGRPGLTGRAPPSPDVDLEWEDAWIDYLEQSGDVAAAQAARWESFERTLSPHRAKAFTARLGDFDDVEAEGRAFAHAAGHPDFQRGLRFLMDWPALPEAAGMIEARADEIDAPPGQVELWAAKLRARRPAAARLLLLKAAAAAFRRRDFKTCDRLTEEADAISA